MKENKMHFSEEKAVNFPLLSLFLPDLKEKRAALRKRFELFTYMTYNKLRIDMRRGLMAHKELMFWKRHAFNWHRGSI